MLNKIKNAIEKKDVGQFNEAMTELVSQVCEGMDDYTRSQFIKEIKFQFPGKKGRLSSPFTEEKVKETGGKRGRPSLTVEEKLARIEAKLEKEKAKILEETKYRELSQEEIQEQYGS